MFLYWGCCVIRRLRAVFPSYSHYLTLVHLDEFHRKINSFSQVLSVALITVTWRNKASWWRQTLIQHTSKDSYTGRISVQISQYDRTALSLHPFLRRSPGCRNSVHNHRQVHCVFVHAHRCVCWGGRGKHTWLSLCKCSGFLISAADRCLWFDFCDSQWKNISSPLSQGLSLTHCRPDTMYVFSKGFVSEKRCDKMQRNKRSSTCTCMQEHSQTFFQYF